MGRTRTIQPGATFQHDSTLSAYAKGEDVGHGVDHDCMDCRIKRQTMKLGVPEQAPLPEGMQPKEPEIPDPNDRGPGAAPPEQNIGADVQDRGDEPTDLEGDGLSDGGLEGRERIVDEQRRTALHAEVERALEESLDTALEEVLQKQGIDLFPRVYHEGDDVIDEMLAVLTSLGVMIMKGYVPDDPRWHVELMTGARRSHVKYASRDVAIKLAAISLFEGEKGAEFERRFAVFNPPPEQVSHYTGHTQGMPR